MRLFLFRKKKKRIMMIKKQHHRSPSLGCCCGWKRGRVFQEACDRSVAVHAGPSTSVHVCVCVLSWPFTRHERCLFARLNRLQCPCQADQYAQVMAQLIACDNPKRPRSRAHHILYPHPPSSTPPPARPRAGSLLHWLNCACPPPSP